MKLKPCPFCGKASRLSYGSDEKEAWVFAMCCSCGIRTPKIYYLHENDELLQAELMALEKWNGRADMDNIEYGIYKIPDKNEVPPTRACCICDEYENKKASIAYVGGWICPECKRRLNRLLYPNCGVKMEES